MNLPPLELLENQLEKVKLLKRLAATPDGKEFLQLLSEMCCFEMSAFNPEMKVENTVYINGKQDVYRDVKALLEADETRIEEQINEYNNLGDDEQ